MLPCTNKAIFGVECMGCGTQRAFYLLMQGEFVEAFKMFPAIYTTIFFFIVAILHFIDHKRKYLNLLIILAILNAIIMFISYAYKMRFLY